MRMRVPIAVAVTILLAFGTSGLLAQGKSRVHVPDSSLEQVGERGQKAHTNHVIALRGADPDAVSGTAGLWPQQIWSAYKIADAEPGGLGTIAIISAFDYPTAWKDFNTFSAQFGLPQETGNGSVFSIAYPNGRPQTTNCGWAQESALDIEWAHALAPKAKIVLVMAKTNAYANLMSAVNYAETLPGISQISMSWGGAEFSFETSYDSTFNGNVTYVAASGDTGGQTVYPGVSPKVVSAGGTSLAMQGLTVIGETGWAGSGGGLSKYEPRPAFQNVLGIAGTKRLVPDLSFNSDPRTGVWVYDSTTCQGLAGWMVVGGTSVAAPALAGIINLAGHHNGSNELATIYSGYASAYSANFRDIVSGNAGSNPAGIGWDSVSGIGSSLGLQGK